MLVALRAKRKISVRVTLYSYDGLEPSTEIEVGLDDAFSTLFDIVPPRLPLLRPVVPLRDSRDTTKSFAELNIGHGFVISLRSAEHAWAPASMPGRM